MNRELLEKPFEPAQIKRRRGRDGPVDYVEGHLIIARLNEAFEGKWSFEIVRHDILEDRGEILVLGKLSAEGVVKMQFGVSQITRDRETKEIVSLGDDVKAAGTDALKKCATFLGVGLHLYGKRAASAATQRVAGQREDRGWGGGAPGRGTGRPPAPPSQPAASGNGQERAAQAPAPEQRGGADGPPMPSGRQTPHASASPQAGDGRLDNAQHTAILALAKKRRLSQLELNQAAVKRYGVQVSYLTYRDAAHFIRELQSLA